MRLTVRNAAVVLLGAGYALLWAGGIVSWTLLGGVPLDATWTTPSFLFVAAALLLATTGDRRIAALVGAGLTGLAVEIVGLHTGVLFGRYVYTNELGFAVAGVPVAIGAAWMILFAYACRIVASLRATALWRTVIAAGWMTALDLIIDPLASGPLGYWSWPGGGIFHGVPARNFLAWLVFSSILYALFGRGRPPGAGAEIVGASLLVFFTLIALAQGFMLPAAVGAALCAGHAGIALRRRVPRDAR